MSLTIATFLNRMNLKTESVIAVTGDDKYERQFIV